jgi:fatty-acyl-CoA synthase
MRNAGTGAWPARRAQMTPDRTAFVFRAGDRVAYLGPNHPALGIGGGGPLQ